MMRYIITMNERNMNVFPLASWRAGFVMMHDMAGTSRSTMPAVSDAKMFMQAINVRHCLPSFHDASHCILSIMHVCMSCNRMHYQFVWYQLMW